VRENFSLGAGGGSNLASFPFLVFTFATYIQFVMYNQFTATKQYHASSFANKDSTLTLTAKIIEEEYIFMTYLFFSF
jgi:hypothetical protein